MNYYISHSAKGTTWAKHKYIAIKNGRYIYENIKRNVKYPAVYAKGWLNEKKNLEPYYKQHTGYPTSHIYFGKLSGMYRNEPLDSPSGTQGARLTPGIAEGRKRTGIKIRNGKDSSPSVYGEIAAQKKKEKIKKSVEKIKNALRKHGSKKVKDL